MSLVLFSFFFLFLSYVWLDYPSDFLVLQTFLHFFFVLLCVKRVVCNHPKVVSLFVIILHE